MDIFKKKLPQKSPVIIQVWGTARIQSAASHFTDETTALEKLIYKSARDRIGPQVS